MMNKMIDFCVQCVAALAFYAGDDEYKKNRFTRNRKNPFGLGRKLHQHR